MHTASSVAQACHRLMRGGSRSFFAASLLLPASVRGPVTALYGFCRVADDAIDVRDPAVPVEAALAGLHARLRRIYAGAPMPHAADIAFAAVVERFGIPFALPAALLEGFEWDAVGRRYATLEALHQYAARVAGSVGAMMALLLGGVTPSALARACELGVAMQLTNVARDIGEDARNGRLYLPLAWLHEAGVDPDQWLAAPRFDPALARVVARLLQAADELYERADDGIAELPLACRPAVRAARLIYAEIGRVLQERQFDSVHSRAVVSGRRKLTLAVQGLVLALRVPAPPAAPAPPLPAVQFLVEATLSGSRGRASGTVADAGMYQRTVRIIESFERVAQRNRMARAHSGLDAG